MNDPQTLEVLLRGVAAGASLATGAGLLRSGRRHPARWTGALFCVSAAAFAVHSGGPETSVLGPLHIPVWIVAQGGLGYFWLFAITLFEDRPVTWERWIPAVVMTGIGFLATFAPPAIAPGVWLVFNLMQLGLAGHVLLVIWRGRGGDLVEARRALRGPMLLAITLFCIGISIQQGAETLLNRHLGWAIFLQAVVLVPLCLAAAWAFLQGSPGLFEAQRRATAPEPVEPQDRPALARLEALMGEGQAWRREGLTIGQVAAEVGVPEHRLRRLINGALGYRNFADYLNARRIEAARTALADPANARASISALAFDLGYASLGPFNRAFKEATGETPSAWRVQALAASPDS
ncbi:AraC-like DNA-binding protein [Caulobacter ginsengisoli]|uniref:AraC-like DNA-binding protein n=1 Tax=Caulobacter ginsengisoli TaxID=400775 RepID=A0ABU0IRZ8_9CAUL|nr:AraC family transcriptional regulator [Caulobacter ginsengisoli]MDQ0464787.1 AraC-like DNA-binding protein [Caulobacter ginsengisoli]